MSNKVLLMILDGWGNGDHTKSDVIYSTNPEYINAMTAQYPHAELKTDGENVGLPEGLTKSYKQTLIQTCALTGIGIWLCLVQWGMAMWSC